MLPTMPIEKINGIDVHYETQGSGEPLLFIHGLGSSARDWHLQVDHFSSSYRVISYDVRGHGASEKPPAPYSMQLFADDARALLEHLDIKWAHIVGISMGGMIAFQMAVDHPSAVRSMVIVNAGPELKPRSMRERLQIWQRVLIVRFLGMRSMAKVVAPRLFPGPSHRALRSQFIERWSANDKRAYLASMRAIVGWGVMEQLSKISAPTLFVAADHDYTPVELKGSYVSELPNARLEVIEDSRHATSLERPDELNRILEEFLAAV
jgi:pimeloyl-ACP methyl ester carboxylesterase